MPFKAILPVFSLVFIGWIISALAVASTFWVFAYWFPKKFRVQRFIRFEFVTVWFTFTTVAFFIYRSLQDYFGDDFALDDSLFKLTVLMILIIMSTLSVLIAWRRNCLEKILCWINSHISPLVWLFSFLLIFAVSSLIFRDDPIKTYTASNTSTGFANKERPNIILVTMDTLTATDMQLYGYHRPTTPFIEKWAKDAVVFTRAYSTSNWTTPSTMSIMTGQLPWTHGIWYEPHYYPVVSYENSLPRILKENGYEVYGFVQNTLAHPRILGISDSFSVKDEAHTFLIPDNWWVAKLMVFFSKQRIATEMMLENNPVFKPLNLKYPHYLAYVRLILYSSLIRSEEVYSRFLEHLTSNPKEPFFAWIHVFPPHDPYVPPVTYSGVFGDADRFSTGEEQLASNLLYRYYDPDRQDEVDILRKRYDESILYSDKQFEIFLKRLAKIIDMSNTVVILTSDHGEIFSHGYVAHNGEHLYEPLIHIPLIIKMPGKGRGIVSDDLVSQIDIAPTILDIAGIPVPSWMEGRSLLPLIENKPFEPREVFSMQLLRNPAIGNRPITKGTIAVIEGDYKLINHIDEEKLLLFNLRLDPYEKQNLANEEPEIAQRLKKLIDEKLSIVNDKIVKNRKTGVSS